MEKSIRHLLCRILHISVVAFAVFAVGSVSWIYLAGSCSLRSLLILMADKKNDL